MTLDATCYYVVQDVFLSKLLNFFDKKNNHISPFT